LSGKKFFKNKQDLESRKQRFFDQEKIECYPSLTLWGTQKPKCRPGDAVLLYVEDHFIVVGIIGKFYPFFFQSNIL
jgi:hypothetical protein